MVRRALLAVGVLTGSLFGNTPKTAAAASGFNSEADTFITQLMTRVAANHPGMLTRARRRALEKVLSNLNGINALELRQTIASLISQTPSFRKPLSESVSSARPTAGRQFAPLLATIESVLKETSHS